MQNEGNKGVVGSQVPPHRTPIQLPNDALEDAKVMQLKDKSPIPANKRRVSKNNNPSAFSHKGSDGAV